MCPHRRHILVTIIVSIFRCYKCHSTAQWSERICCNVRPMCGTLSLRYLCKAERKFSFIAAFFAPSGCICDYVFSKSTLYTHYSRESERHKLFSKIEVTPCMSSDFVKNADASEAGKIPASNNIACISSVALRVLILKNLRPCACATQADCSWDERVTLRQF